MSEPSTRAAFEKREVVIPIDTIVPQKEITPAFRRSRTYRQIAVSVEDIGLIEPVVVFPRGPGGYLLLDGHVRIDVLKRAHATEVRAIFATDDEAYTYNKRVNHAPPVAQHFMILKAIANGVSEERIAEALDVNVGSIRKKRTMLDGICPEVVEILRNSHVTADAFAMLRQMKPIRQIEAAEHMAASGTYSVRFAKALLAVTKPELLLESPSSRKVQATSAAARDMLEQETETLLRDLKAVEDCYGADILTLTVGCGYVERLLGNGNIERHLSKYHPDILTTLRSLLSEIKPGRSKPAAA